MNRINEKFEIYKNEQGSALVISVFSILLVTVIAFALVAKGLISQEISKNSREQTEAFYIAESGLTHALNLVRAVDKSQYTNILKAGDQIAGTGDELSTQPASLTPIPSTGITMGTGYYKVFVSDDQDDTDGDPNVDSNGRLVIKSVGYGSNGATVTLEAIISSQQSGGRIAILADGDIINTNKVFTTGDDGIIHANGSFQTSSNVCIEQYVSESTSYSMNLSKITSGTSCSTPGTVGTNVYYSKPTRTPEIYDTTALQNNFRSQATYLFKSNGKIFKQGSSNAMTSAEITADNLSGWSYSPSAKLWSYSSSTVLTEGIYYMESSSIKITNGGSDTTPPKVTLITEGSIEITNAPAFQPKLPGYALLAANDIKISSKIGVSGNPGLVYAYGQMEITNQSTFYGWLQAANFRRSDGTNGIDANDPGGNNLVPVASKGTLRLSNVTTVNTPSGGSGTGTAMTVISQREVRY